MLQPTTIIAFDQHVSTTMAAVLLPGHRTPALHPLTSDSGTILRFIERLRRRAVSSDILHLSARVLAIHGMGKVQVRSG